jgi:hypothetical protein
MMNITRLTLSVTLLLSVAAISAHNEVTSTPCSHGCEHHVSVPAVETEVAPEAVVKTVSVDDLVETAKNDFNLNEAEVTELRARLEADITADIAAIVAEIRTAAVEAQAATKAAEVAEVMI